MKKWEIIKKKKEFNEIIKNQPFLKNKSFVIYIKQKEELTPHFGIAISKKIGNAVLRNHLKRQTRVILDDLKENFKKQRDYIIMIKRSCIDESFKEKKNDLEKLIKEIK